MEQKDKELLLKDICCRLPYGVKISYYDLDEEILKCDTLEGIERSFVTVDGFQWEITDIKPYLFPLSSITIEQEKELSKLGVSYSEYALHDDIRGLGIMIDEAYIFFEFCYKHHIDFLGLIGMGLAIDATGLNIY